MVEWFLRFTIFLRIFWEDRQRSQACHLEWIRLAKTSTMTETHLESLVADGQEDLVDIERDDEIHNETEDKGNESVTTVKKELSQVNKAAAERKQNVKNMLNNGKDKKMAAKLRIKSQLLQISRDDLDFK